MSNPRFCWKSHIPTISSLWQKCFTDMACSKHGSRVLESLWKVASIKAKTQICDELVTDEFKLKANPFGKIIFNKFQVCI